MAMTNAEWLLKQGIKFRHIAVYNYTLSAEPQSISIGYYDMDCEVVYHECYKGEKLGGTAYDSILIWLDMEHEETEAKNNNVKHAHWIHDHDVEHYGKSDGAYWRCSSCGRILKDSNWFSYCPMCGARMDGEIEGKRK